MKRLLTIILSLIMVLGLIACDQETQNSNNSNTEVVVKQSNTKEETNKSKELSNDKINNIKFDYSYKVPMKNIVIDVPNWQEMEKGFTQLYILHGLKFVAFTAEKNSTTENLDVAHEDAFDKFKQNVHNYCHITDVNFTSTKEDNINGVKVFYYEGELNCEENKNSYIIGYSFIMDGISCNVTGSVIGEDGKLYQMNGKELTFNYEEEVDLMKDTVNAMIKTLRSER